MQQDLHLRSEYISAESKRALFAKALAVARATLKTLLGDVMDSTQPIRRMLSTTTLHAKAATIPTVSTRQRMRRA
jgi:hypothetical protein